ncbi:MAG: TatD family hydrolase, partial [Cetobacterium sp.]
MKLVDTHCHLDNEKFDEDRLEVIERIKENLEFCVNIGYDLVSSKKSLELAKEYDFIYAVIGVHPIDIAEYNEEVEKELEILGKNP